MPDLATFQRYFVDLIDGQGEGDPLIAVYRNTSLKGVLDALADNYPTVTAIVGQPDFAELTMAFVADHPPGSPVLAGYGVGLADWLERHPIIDELPYLSGVALIDRLRTEAHLAPDADTLDPARLAMWSAARWAGSAARLHPATRFAWFILPAPSIWLAHLDPDETEIAPDWSAEGILLTRRNHEIVARRIDAAEHRILAGLRLGETMGEAAAAAAKLYPQADISHVFRTIFESGALSSLRSPEFQ